MAPVRPMNAVRFRGRGDSVLLAVLALLSGIFAAVAHSPILAALAFGSLVALLIALIVPSRSRSDAQHVAADASEASPPASPAEPRTMLIPPTLDNTALLHVLAGALGAEAPVVAVHLWLQDPSSATLRLVTSIGPMSPSPQPVALDDPILGAAVRNGVAMLQPLAKVQTAETSQIIWRFALPLCPGEANGVVAADLSVENDPDGGSLARLSAPLLGPLAGGLALHVAHIETEMATALLEVARDLSRLLDPDEVLATALRTAMSISEAATGSLMLIDPDSGKLVIAKAHGLPQKVVAETNLSEGEGIAGWVLSTGQPLLIEDLSTQPQTGRRHGVRSAVSVPIADSDGALGVINVGSRGFPARFTESHMHALETLGKQTAVALRNARALTSTRELYFDTLKALSLALETKDPYARGGTERVLALATAIGEAYGLPDDEQEALRVASLLHDIGMSTAGDSLGSGRRPLSTIEHGLVKLHPQIAAEILDELPALRSVAPIVYHHHEWFDGQGYLNGLSGEAIPLGARILAVADAYVAMTSGRSYRAALSQSQAMGELQEKAGTQFDPAVVDVLRDILRAGNDRAPDWMRS